MHDGDDSAIPAPYTPAGHTTAVPAVQYEPGGHACWYIWYDALVALYDGPVK